MNDEIESRAYARAGLLGNPSDGYGGKTISFTFEQYFARVRLAESAGVVITAGENDSLEYSSPRQMSDCIRANGYYGGVRLIKAAIYRLYDYCQEFGFPFDRPFKISYDSNIPRQVGLAGSSAIVIATLRSLCQWNEVNIEPGILAALALESENALGITAGPQDRVIQSFEGMMYMDFANPESINGLACGQYSRLTVGDDHNLYIAFSLAASEPTEVLHEGLKSKMNRQDAATVATIEKIAELATQGRRAIELNDLDLLAELIDDNFDLRQSVCSLNPFHIKMVETARKVGASAKYCGSGGAIVGTIRQPGMFESLQQQLGSMGCTVLRPKIVEPQTTQAP